MVKWKVEGSCLVMSSGVGSSFGVLGLFGVYFSWDLVLFLREGGLFVDLGGLGMVWAGFGRCSTAGQRVILLSGMA